MLKPQDVVILLKLLANMEKHWTQRQLATELCFSQSEIHAGMKRLSEAGLVRAARQGVEQSPVVEAAKEYLIHGVRYSFPSKLGEFTRGIATGIAAPVFAGKIVMGNDPIPVWPYGKGQAQGVALKPLYSSVPKSISDYPDQPFYDLLSLVDIFRVGRARERAIAIKILEEKLTYEK